MLKFIQDQNADKHITSQPTDDNNQIDAPIVIPVDGSAEEVESATSSISDTNIAEIGENITVNATDESANTTALFVCNIDKEDGGKPVEVYLSSSKVSEWTPFLDKYLSIKLMKV